MDHNKSVGVADAPPVTDIELLATMLRSSGPAAAMDLAGRLLHRFGSLRALLVVGGTAIIGMHAWLAHAFYTGGRRDRDDGIALDHLLRAHIPGPVWPVAKRPYKPVVAHFILVAITFLLVLFAVFVAPGASAS